MTQPTIVVVTDRQAAIIRGLAAGLTIVQLGTRLDRNTMTIHRDLQRIRQLVGATTNSQLIDRAWRMGLLGADPPLAHEEPIPDTFTIRPLRRRTPKAATS